jgi:hypothetical protein
MTEENKLKVTFAPGCFDEFEGTQEELDELIAEIQLAVENGELLGNSEELTDEAFDELPDEIKEKLLQTLSEEFSDAPKRTLQ